MEAVSNIRNRAWYATLEGRYEDALRIYDEELAPLNEPKHVGHLTNPAILHLLMGNLDRAIDTLREARDLPAPPALPQPFVGAILWIKGERTAACEDWVYEIGRRDAGDITHCDDAGGVQVPALLWWASAHPGFEKWRKPAEKALKRRSITQRCKSSRWPGPLARLLLGQSSGEVMSDEKIAEMVSVIKYSNINFRNQSLAHLYLGAACLARGDAISYDDHLRYVIAKMPVDTTTDSAALVFDLRITHPEYHLAYAELGAFP